MPDDLNAVAERLERDLTLRAEDLGIAAECIRLVAQIRGGDEGMVERVAAAISAVPFDLDEELDPDNPAKAWMPEARAALRAIGGEG